MTDIATSETSALSNTQGTTCKIGRFINPAEGLRIVQVASSWESTPYALVGIKSIKGKQGDCSGSSHHIYTEAGFPYPYQTSKTITEYIDKSHRFRAIAGTTADPAQDGDLIVWPGGHIAIYASFAPIDARATNRFGKKNNMWSAHYPGGPAYGAERAEGFRKNEKIYFYRYYLLPGDPGCP